MHPLFQIRQNLCVIRERYGVSRIGLFGSVARGEETPASDIDV
ncbi:MAG: nucleotidyltransferase domain-containing protein, partial [Methanoculleus sp.]|nr:nucleotidyltransferase domain-containing protein [Methanoculleus sp.]